MAGMKERTAPQSKIGLQKGGPIFLNLEGVNPNGKRRFMRS